MAARKKSATPEAPPEPVRVQVLGDHALLHLEGSVGVAQAKRLHQLALKLAGAGCEVRVRGEHLQHLDAAAVQVLLALGETLRRNGVRMSVQNLPDSVQETLRTGGLASAF